MDEKHLEIATRAVCTRNFGGYCECIGHEAHGCMVGYGEAPDVSNCKMTAEAMPLTAEYQMATAALEAITAGTRSAETWNRLRPKDARVVPKAIAHTLSYPINQA